MHTLAPKCQPTPRLRLRLLALAALLVVAQLLSQLHATEHLGEHGDDAQHGAVCLVCIATAGLDARHVDVAWLRDGRAQPPCAAPASGAAQVTRPLAAYRVRAPPALPSMT